jgi:hypothetical protein
MTLEVLKGALVVVGMFYLATKMVLAVMVYWKATHYDEVVAADDPVVIAQVAAYRAEQDRARRHYLSDLAEKAQGNPQNMRGEERLTAEKMGQAVASFAADLIAKEIAARRHFKLGLFAAATSLVSKP